MRFLLPSLAVLSALSLLSCTTIDGEHTSTADFTEGVPGGTYSETTTITATVTGIDAAKRKLTFVTPKGKKFSSTAGEEVLNFDQIEVGDQLTATLTDEVVIRMAKPGEKLADSTELEADMAQAGDKPSMKTVESSQMIGTITRISPRRERVTLTFANGKTQRVKVREDIDLYEFKVGDRVVIQLTEIYAVGLKKP